MYNEIADMGGIVPTDTETETTQLGVFHVVYVRPRIKHVTVWNASIIMERHDHTATAPCGVRSADTSALTRANSSMI